jgi:hypothetical protein
MNRISKSESGLRMQEQIEEDRLPKYASSESRSGCAHHPANCVDVWISAQLLCLTTAICLVLGYVKHQQMRVHSLSKRIG